MAISQTMSNASSDWLLPVYQTDFTSSVQMETPPTIPTANTAAARNTSLVPADHGRISKPIRRRSRASRRTPTTLLNTDAANFRAMVQQFTGGPAARFAAAPHHLPAAGAMLGFAAPTPMPPVANNTTTESGFHVQFPNQTMQQVYAMDNLNRGGYSPAAASATEMNRSDYGNYMMLR